MALLHILLVEDDPLARQQLTRMLERASIACRACAEADDALGLLRRERFDVIATDWRLGGSALAVDGVKLTQIVRELSVRTPVLLYSSRAWTSVDVARAIDAGADDFLEAPLERFDEFVARLRGLVRRSSARMPVERLRVAGFEIDIPSREANFHGRNLALTRAQFELLVHFCLNVEKLLTYDELYSFLAGATRAPREERVHLVHENVRRLRTRLSDGADCIVTVPGAGYRLIGV